MSVVQQRSDAVCKKIGFNPLTDVNCRGQSGVGEPCKHRIPQQLRELAFYIFGHGAHLSPTSDELREILKEAAKQLYCYEQHENTDELVNTWLANWVQSDHDGDMGEHTGESSSVVEESPDRVPTPFDVPREHLLQSWRPEPAVDAPRLVFYSPYQPGGRYRNFSDGSIRPIRRSATPTRRSMLADAGRTLWRAVSNSFAGLRGPNALIATAPAESVPSSASLTQSTMITDSALSPHSDPLIECDVCTRMVDTSNPRRVQRCPRCQHTIHLRCFNQWVQRSDLLGQEPSCPYCRANIRLS